MTNLWLPAGVTGGAVGADPSWWSDRANGLPEGVGVDVSEDGVSVTTPGDEDAAVVFVAPITGWLAGAHHQDRLSALADWEQEILGLVTETGLALRLVGVARPPHSVAELIELASGHRWPLDDPAQAARHDARTEPVTTAHTEDPGPIGVYARALVGAVTPSVRTSWSTARMGVADALTGLELGTATPGDGLAARDSWVAPSDEQAHQLREATRLLLHRLDTAGVQVLGQRAALLWAIPADDGRLAPQVAAEAATAALRAQARAQVEWPEALPRLNQLELDVRRLRAERATAPRTLSSLSGRELLALLRRRRSQSGASDE
ncbi:MAG: hypothetical protein L0H31_04920 [Nocardioidaceae bacterium]|nr:hypothetical protein [Nocardioidaceae bacterium]